jgi:cephalosporin hydroxylase
MARGTVQLTGTPRLLVTVDITDLDPGLHEIPGIKKLTGDANSQAIIEEVVAIFQGQPIDLLYIDADHNFEPTLTNLGIYLTLLRPAWIILDDIVLTPKMAAMWNVLQVAFGRDAINCVDHVPVRRETCGFGLIRTGF